MQNSIVQVPIPDNEPIRSYAPGTSERALLKEKITELKSKEIEIPLIIDGKEIFTGRTANCVMPHDHKHVLASQTVSPSNRTSNQRSLNISPIHGAFP